MVDNFTVALRFESEGIPKTIADVKKISDSIKKIRDENERVAKTAKVLSDAYELTAEEAAQVQVAIARAAAEQERASKSAAAEAERARVQFERTVAVVSAGLAAGIGAFITNSVKDFSQFDGAIRQAGVISGASEGEIKALREEIERLGIVTSATPDQIAQTSVALSRAGFTAQEQTDAFEGIVRASEATGTALESVGETIGTTIRTFGLATDEASGVADVLVSATNSTNTSVETLSESLKFVGPSAAAADQSLEDITVLIGLLGDQGIKGSQAGTNLASALDRLKLASAGANSEFSSLVRGNAKQVEAFEKINIAVRNTDGSMASILELIPAIRNSLEGLAQEDQDILIKSLFGVEGGRAFQALLNTSQQRIDEVTRTVRNSQGVAVESGEALLQGLSGALNLFEGSLSATSAQFGEFVAIGVEPVVRGATLLLNTFLALPAPLQAVVIGTTALAGALAAAVAAITAYNLANGQRVTQEALAAANAIRNTAATVAQGAALQVAAAAQATYATITGQATAAQIAQTAALAGAAVTLAAVAGAAGSIAAAVGTFRSVDSEASKLRDTADQLQTSFENIRDTEPLAETSNDVERASENLNFFERTLDTLIRGPIPGLATAAEASANRTSIAFNEIVAATDDIRLSAAQTANALENGVTVDPAEVERTVSSIDDAIAALENLEQTTPEATQRIEAQIAALQEYRERIVSTDEGLTSLADTTDDLKNRLESLNDTLNSGQLAIQQAGTAAIAALEEQRAAGTVSAEEYQSQLANIERAGFNDRINLAQEKLIELQQLERAATDDEVIAQIQQEILQTQLTIDKDRIASARTRVEEAERLEQAQTEAAKKAAEERRDAAIEAAEKETDALRKEREEQERVATEEFQASQRRESLLFDEQERQEQTRFENQQRQAEERFQDQLRADQSTFEDGQRAAQQAFENRQRSQQETFNDRQRDQERRFQDQINAARDQGNREFDALDREVDNRVALLTASSKEERETIQDRIDAEEEAADIRRKVEADVLRQRNSIVDDEDTELSPLEQARADFEADLQAQEQEFQDTQRADAAEFEDAQRLAKQEFEDGQRLAQASFEEEQRTLQQAFDNDQRTLEDQFNRGQRQEQARFELGQQQAESEFKANQRTLDEQSANRIADILENARNVGGQSLRAGGVAEGGVVQVHKDEFLLPPKGTRVVSQAESRRLIANYLNSGGSGVGRVTSVPASTQAVERKLDKLIETVQRRPRPKAQATINMAPEATKSDAIKTAMQLQRAQFRSMGF